MGRQDWWIEPHSEELACATMTRHTILQETP